MTEYHTLFSQDWGGRETMDLTDVGRPEIQPDYRLFLGTGNFFRDIEATKRFAASLSEAIAVWEKEQSA